MANVLVRTIIPSFVLLMLGVPAFADAIDGNWCHTDGRRFSISGPEILTPSGAKMQGNYSRHAFSYPVPAQEPHAGQTAFMTLANENTVFLRHGEATDGQETWVRCGPSISVLKLLPRA